MPSETSDAGVELPACLLIPGFAGDASILFTPRCRQLTSGYS